MLDRFGRAITYLRVSITDRCNHHCSYCRSPKDTFKRREEILSFDEITRIVRILGAMGLKKVRLTGGEPLVRKDAPTLVGMLSALDGIAEVTMTTNAVLLGRYARELKERGLTRLNISLDTLDPGRYRDMTGGGQIGPVLQGILAAQAEGFNPLRINTVLMRGVNEDDLSGVIDYAASIGATLRFIECMPMRDGLDWKAHYLPIFEVLARPDIKERVDVTAQVERRNEAAFFLPLKNKEGKGKVGFISPISNRFCENCNRLRLTADGKIRTCLPSDYDIDLLSALKQGSDDTRVASLIREAVLLKPETGEYNFSDEGRKRSMLQIGG